MKDKNKLVEKEFVDNSVSLEIEETQRSYAFGEPRVGKALFRTIDARNLDAIEIDAEKIRSRSNAVLTSTDEKFAIREVIEKFEQLSPEDVLKHHGKLTLDEYISVSDGEAMTIDKDAVKKWLKSDLFKELSANEKGIAEITEFDVTLIDERTSVVVYSIVQNGKTGTSSATLVKGDSGWRIVVHSQHPVVV
ncbi:hypothetical protein [Vibrio parahaemolyticus]|uniref:hypothetical protein n=1 Tax=Vibrio parahaemolyticus TaxID=670 RepID=UPI0011EEFCCA|nr:hypothetical protein [Vibrio parahaemolyticus]KAB5597574.1 hypothetical protein F0578_21500 [Vibrio parahaemolyticus]